MKRNAAERLKSLVRRPLAACGYRIEHAPTSAHPLAFRMRRIGTDDDPIVRVAKAHLDAAVTPADLPPLGERWGAQAARLRSRIRRIGSTEELILLGQSPAAGVETHFRPEELLGHCHSLDLRLLADLSRKDLYDALGSFHSPRVIRTDSIVRYRGRSIDYVSLCAADMILRLLDLLGDDRPRTICDLGGGTGTTARAWLTSSAHRPDLVAIVDIPETLVYSEALLRSELGDSRVQYITDPGMAPSSSGVVLCPIANVRALEVIAFDLVTNVKSMQEMTDAWVDWYMAWLDRQACRYFFSDNYFASALTNMREGHNSWSPRPSARWQLIDARVLLRHRSVATMLFRKDGGAAGPAQPTPAAPKGAQAWLAHLELARCHKDEQSLRQALAFAQSGLPFVPKEAWQVAKSLSEMTGAAADREVFDELDRMRRRGNEAAH